MRFQLNLRDCLLIVAILAGISWGVSLEFRLHHSWEIVSVERRVSGTVTIKFKNGDSLYMDSKVLKQYYPKMNAAVLAVEKSQDAK